MTWVPFGGLVSGKVKVPITVYDMQLGRPDAGQLHSCVGRLPTLAKRKVRLSTIILVFVLRVNYLESFGEVGSSIKQYCLLS